MSYTIVKSAEPLTIARQYVKQENPFEALLADCVKGETYEFIVDKADEKNGASKDSTAHSKAISQLRRAATDRVDADNPKGHGISIQSSAPNKVGARLVKFVLKDKRVVEKSEPTA